MTVEVQTTKITANGNGTATSFSFSPLVIFASSDLVVTRVASDGTETTLTETTDYTVVPTGAYPSTGSITYPATGATKLAVGESLVMKRVLTIEQTTDLENQGGYFPDTQETALDKLTMIDLQQQESIDRSIKIPVSDSGITVELPAAASRAGKGLVFDSNGNIIAGSLSSVAVSAAMTPVVEAATLATARATLGAAASTQKITAGTGISGGGDLSADRTISIDPSFLRGYLAGLTLSNDGVSPNTKLDVAAGVAVDDTDAVLMKSTASLTIDCATVGANGLDAGALANSTWYFVFLIAKADGTVAGLVSSSVASPTLPAGYTYKRRIGCIKTDGSAHILAFTQFGDEFFWGSLVQEFNGTAPIVATALSLAGVPAGVRTFGLLTASIHAGTTVENNAYNVYTPGLPPRTVIAGGQGSATELVFTAACEVLVTLSGATPQVTHSATVARTATLSTYGWRDTRGRDA